MNTTATPLLLSALLTLTSPALAQDKEAAKEHFEKGVELFNNEDWVGALVEFKAAYEAAPHHAVRYNISACLYKLHRYSEAVAEMNAYLVEGGDEVPQDKREEVLGYLEEMSGLVGQLTVTSDVPGSVVLVNGEPVATLPLGEPLWLDVGEYKIVVKAPGHDPFITTLLLPGGGQEDHPREVHRRIRAHRRPGRNGDEDGLGRQRGRIR